MGGYMERPQSITWFGPCYFGPIAIGLIGTPLKWGAIQTVTQDNPAVAQLGPGFMAMTMTIGVAIVVGVKLLLWFGAARKGWAVCKWFVAIFFVLGLLFTGLGLIGGKVPHGIDGVLWLTATILSALSVWFLFRADTEAWFG